MIARSCERSSAANATAEALPVVGVIAVAGATGYIGGLLCARLRGEGMEVRALAREPEPARSWPGSAAMSQVADVLEPETLASALEGVDVAYYLVHSMGRGSDGDFAQRDHAGAENFAAAAAAAGVRRIVYLGGLGEGSVHLDSRHATARDPARRQGAGHLLPRRRGDRRRQRVVPHRLPPRPPPAGDGHAEAGSPPAPSRSRSTTPSPTWPPPPTSKPTLDREIQSAAPTSPPTAG